jgi:hypothetical protein
MQVDVLRCTGECWCDAQAADSRRCFPEGQVVDVRVCEEGEEMIALTVLEAVPIVIQSALLILVLTIAIFTVWKR